MRPIELTSWLPSNRAAITLCPFILYTKAYRYDQCIRVHEHYHWKQALRWGILPWYIWYLILWLRYGYNQNHPLERQAYRLEAECRKNE